jgi:serine/threonine protein kinase
VLDVATGLAYLHSVGVPHGDLRAANILVLGHGQACLADYAAGVLKAAGPAPREEVKQGPDGTRRPRPTRWMSPEVMRGQPWDAKADVYSLGMTVYEVISVMLLDQYMD